MSDFLFAMPSPLYGVAQLLNIWRQFYVYNNSPDTETADRWALLSDQIAINDDLRQAMVRLLIEEPDALAQLKALMRQSEAGADA